MGDPTSDVGATLPKTKAVDQVLSPMNPMTPTGACLS